MKILVIDDEPGLRKSLSLILGDAGYTVVTASDGEEGLRKLEEDRPELVLCDIRMPGLGGLDFLARARESGAEALILIMDRLRQHGSGGAGHEGRGLRLHPQSPSVPTRSSSPSGRPRSGKQLQRGGGGAAPAGGPGGPALLGEMWPARRG